MNQILILLFLLASSTFCQGQRDDLVLPKEKKEFAFQSIKELKEGVIVVRLKARERKISSLEATLRNPKLNKRQRKRYQRILDGTIQRRDKWNNAIAGMFVDSFSFCPYYIMYDTASHALMNGQRQGMFLNDSLQIDPSIKIDAEHIFLINYRSQSGEFPFDVLLMRKLHERLEDPFPFFVQLRESWINNVNTPGAEKAVARLDRKLHNFYARAKAWEEKQAAKKAKKASKDKN